VIVQILGTARIILICLLLVLNAAAVFFLTQYIVVEKERAEVTLQSVNGEISNLRSEIAKLWEEFTELRAQLKEFRILEAKKFFNDQSRVLARDYLDYLSRRNELTKMRYDIRQASIGVTPETMEADYRIVKSPISIDIEAYHDLDVVAFMKMIMETFPGIIHIDGISMERSSDIDGTTLVAMQKGETRTFVRSKLDLSWYTMISQAEVQRIEGLLPVGAP